MNKQSPLRNYTHTKKNPGGRYQQCLQQR